MNDLFTVMCRGSKRLQEAWKPKMGDRFYSKEFDKEDMNWFTIGNAYVGNYKLKDDIEDDWKFRTDGCSCCSCELNGKKVWLPTQSDLQGLYISTTGDFCTWKHFKEFFDSGNVKLCDVFTIGWLLFVHKELWNQTWDFKEKRWVEDV